MRDFDPITLEILWSRLIAIVDESAATLIRTSFSTIVRESNDYACVLLDTEGNSLAQSTLSIPSFIGTLPVTVRAMLRRFPAETLQPGDVLLTNDPWLGAGHLNDLNIAVPVFHQGRLLAISATVAHAPDIGGRQMMPDNRDLFEEGLFIPITKLYDGGRRNDVLVDIIRHNVRVPDEVIGDIEAQILANHVAASRLLELVEEYQISDLRELARTIQHQSEKATRTGIRRLPAGTYRHQMTIDGFNCEFEICLALTVDHEQERILCDYSGTSPQVTAAYNVVPNYTYAYTAFGLKCILAPDVPNNEGCFRPVVVTAPDGSLLNPRFPAAVVCRGPIGHYLPTVVFCALAEAVPDRVLAGSSLSFWGLTLSGTWPDGRPFVSTFFLNGGFGAARDRDGINCLTFPSNLSCTPTEVLEHTFPIEFTRKEFAPGSGGPGRWRGGLGQITEFEVVNPTPITVAFIPSRIKHPAPGLFGGGPGQVGSALLNGEWINPNFKAVLQPGDRLTITAPGGGGFGSPAERDPLSLRTDLLEGYVPSLES